MTTEGIDGKSVGRLKAKQKRWVERDFKTRIEGTGGTYIGINWKHGVVHFLTPTGKRDSKYIQIQ